MNKNPFSFYDFLGYLFPGIIILALAVFVVALTKENALIEEYFQINKFVSVFQDKQGLKWWETTILAIILAYVAGHLVSYLSSVIVEYFANTLFGYPSYYLLHKVQIGFIGFCLRYFMPSLFDWDFKSAWACKKKWTRKKILPKIKVYWAKINIGRLLWRVFIFALMFPISIPLMLLGKCLKITDFVVRPLDDYVCNGIQRKLFQLSQTLNLDIPDVNYKSDYHRIVMHYVYLNIPNCQRKADNYVAIYGFLRAMTLIACIYFDYFFYWQMFTLNIHTDVNWNAVLILFLMGILCNVLFMGFVKFYRRFTLENYMALLTEK